MEAITRHFLIWYTWFVVMQVLLLMLERVVHQGGP